MKLGAYDLVQKPLDTVSLEVLVNHALEDRRLIDEVADLRCRLQRKSAYHNLLGQSPGMTEVFERVARVGSSSCTVFITGETGTGKELVAQAIHFSDVTRRGPLVAVNCAALPEHLLESELFGHERGAFTGADRQKKGRFELAEGGTLFLDEIGEMPLGMQAKLLRVLQDGRFERVGGTDAIQTDCRVIAATNMVLAEGRRRRPIPRRSLLSPQRRIDRTCPLCASGWKTSRSWSTTSSTRSPRKACPSKRSRDRLSPGS